MEAAPTVDTRGAIIEAAARLLREQGVRAVTTRGVAQAAGVQAPTIYRLFGDKDGLIEAVAEQEMATYVAAKASTVADRDPVAALRAGWRRHLDFALANPDLYALLSAPGSNRASPALAAGITVLRGLVHRIAEAGRLRVDEQRAVTMIQAAGAGTVSALLEVPPDRRDGSLIDAMFDAVAAGILTDPGEPADAGAASVAIQFSTLVADLPGLSEAERGLMAEWLARSITLLQRDAIGVTSPDR
jgi:AcrR family transcriptional regulator